MRKLAIGIDFGTLSARALLVDVKTGEAVAQQVYTYPHGIMDASLPCGVPLEPGFALQDPMDYLDGLITSIRLLMKESGADPREIVGIGLDVTAATLLPVTRDKMPLCTKPEFIREPQAYMKLWKHHGAEKEAATVTETARERGETWLPYYGGRISSEWTIPKVLETLHRAPHVYEAADCFVEAMDWLIWHMTGTLSASACGMGYKAQYFREQFPSEDFFSALDQRMRTFIRDKFSMPVRPIGSTAGTLCSEMAEKMGLLPGIPVATPIIDAHCSVLGSGITGPGDLMIVMGTSSCHLLLSEKEVQVPGAQGIVRDGIMPGYYGLEAGQSCVGDHFAWFVENCLPEAYTVEAREKGLNAHELLAEKLQGYRAGASGLIALDWFNGVRSPLMDFDLNGLLIGMNLRTRPEDIYLALMEATAFGTRVIMESFEKADVPVNRIILGGGIPAKNPLIVQIYADVLRRPILVNANSQSCALGAAALGIHAADGGTGSLSEVVARLGKLQDTVYLPDESQASVYDRLYSEYLRLSDTFGRGGNDVMRRLNALRKG